MTTTIDNPILNSPYEAPDQHYEIGPQGPTGEIKTGRRPSESFIPIAITKKGKRGKDDSQQEVIDFDATGERREKNSLINRLRQDAGPPDAAAGASSRVPRRCRPTSSADRVRAGPPSCCRGTARSCSNWWARRWRS